ncbi:uncharacterized protein CELE_Y39G10AR.25 [Caenorhabditis elegans]|uniref:PEEL-1 n=1 Tax=Caenorhabditis elegans TaxID=6239 RepID=G5EGC6_CAEEL|nr:Uncharacterized protein CELE_Y39G10AR.25 [Caenorhabditis elegans]AEN71565.1 PEEL-1 [Caenorhabditis elegans]CCD69923.1 Uncharacterized protein CELE_Y39G10AR.25 [Caenorhabditis elegans]|eukprot:NP_001249145.1 Uncharacterized protein CELE_Y39G10AR.25 [Caenorhabditis elegans]
MRFDFQNLKFSMIFIFLWNIIVGFLLALVKIFKIYMYLDLPENVWVNRFAHVIALIGSIASLWLIFFSPFEIKQGRFSVSSKTILLLVCKGLIGLIFLAQIFAHVLYIDPCQNMLLSLNSALFSLLLNYYESRGAIHPLMELVQTAGLRPTLCAAVRFNCLNSTAHIDPSVENP